MAAVAPQVGVAVPQDPFAEDNLVVWALLFSAAPGRMGLPGRGERPRCLGSLRSTQLCGQGVAVLSCVNAWMGQIGGGW